jgi:predicted Zn-ribbon and HTH transcriptional regulator
VANGNLSNMEFVIWGVVVFFIVVIGGFGLLLLFVIFAMISQAFERTTWHTPIESMMPNLRGKPLEPVLLDMPQPYCGGCGYCFEDTSEKLCPECETTRVTKPTWWNFADTDLYKQFHGDD